MLDQHPSKHASTETLKAWYIIWQTTYQIDYGNKWIMPGHMVKRRPFK